MKPSRWDFWFVYLLDARNPILRENAVLKTLRYEQFVPGTVMLRWKKEISMTFTLILNLTQHDGTPEQGVVEPTNKERVRTLLTFSTIPTRQEVERRATDLALIAIAEGASAAMIGGAPYLIPPLEAALKAVGVRPLYAFSVRESVERTDPATGEVRKTAIFRHLGWVGED